MLRGDNLVKFQDAVYVINLNIRNNPEMLNIRKALNAPVVQRDFQSCNAQLNYQVILPTPSSENLFQVRNHLTHFSASAATSVYQVGSLCSVETFEAPEHYDRAPERYDPKATRKFPSTA